MFVFCILQFLAIWFVNIWRVRSGNWKYSTRRQSRELKQSIFTVSKSFVIFITVGSYLCSDKCLPYRIWRLLLKEAQPTKKALTHILNFLQSEPQSFGDKKWYEHIMLLQDRRPFSPFFVANKPKQKRALMALTSIEGIYHFVCLL